MIDDRAWRLITDLDACLDDPAIGDLFGAHLTRVRHVGGVHAKLVLGPDAALFGSANLTQQGFQRRHELGVLVREPGTLTELGAWFEALWEAGHVITAEQVAGCAARAATSLASRTDASSAPSGLPSHHAGGSLGWMTRPPHAGEPLEELAEQLRHLASTRAEAILVLDLLAEAVQVAGLAVDDPRLHLTFGNRERVAVCVGQRYVAWCKRTRGGSLVGFILDDHDVAASVARQVPGASARTFTKRGLPDAPQLYVPLAACWRPSPSVCASWHRAIRAEVVRGRRSSYHKHKRPFLYRALTDPSARQAILGRAFPSAPAEGVTRDG